MSTLPTADKSKWILIPVEVRIREFLSRFLLACVAAERGYRAIIGKKNPLVGAYPYLPRGMIIEKGIPVFRRRQIDDFRSLGYRICVSDEESLGVYRAPDQFLKRRMSNATLEQTDFVFAWGEKQCRLIDERYPNHSEKLLAVGSPRFDLARPEFRSLFEDKVSDIRRRFGRYILFASNFSEVLSHWGGASYLEEQRSHQKLDLTAVDEGFYRGQVEHKIAAQQVFEEVLPIVRKRFPDHRLVIRPHPGENQELWRHVTKHTVGLELVQEGEVVPWILASDAMFHHGCTSGVEAFLFGKPAVAFHPDYDERFDNHLSTLIGPTAYDTEGLIDLLQAAITKGEIVPDETEWVKDLLWTDPDSLAADRIVDAVDSVEIPPQQLFDDKYRGERRNARLRRKLRSYRKKLRRFISGEAYQPTLATKRWGAMTVHDLREILSKLRGATGRFSNLEVTKMFGQVYCIFDSRGGTQPFG